MYEIYADLLEKFGVSTYQVCKATGIAQGVIGTWKKRRNILGSKNLKKIADYFGVTIDYMLGNEISEIPEPKLPPAEQQALELAKRILALDSKARKTIEDMISIMEKAK